MAKQRSEHFNTLINIISSVGVLIVNLCISFVLSPYIIRTIGVEANGFVSLANNFVTYANLVVTALNAMAARFITIAYIEEDYKKANLYYNSVFWGNLIIVAVLILPAVYLIVRLEHLIDVPANILLDVKLLFSLVFLGFFIRTGAPNYDCGTYIKNRMDLSYVPAMITALFRCVFLFCIFSVLAPRVWYVSLASLLVTLATLAVAGHFTHKLTPELKVNLKHPICSFPVIRELVGSGIWSSIASAGLMLLNGLDLLICNKLIGATMMGVLALSKTLPTILIQLSESIRGAFGPELTISYAIHDQENIKYNINRAMKITSVVVTIPAAGLVVMSDIFYHLWVPSQDAKLLQVLTSLAILSYLVNSGVVILFNVFSTVNKVRYNSVAMLVSGGLSVLTTLALIKWTDLDIYAVAGVSSVFTILKNLFFTVPVGSKLIGFKWYEFFPQVGISTLSCASIIGIGIIVRKVLPAPNSWISFFLMSILIGSLGLIVNLFLVLSRDERNYFIRKFIRKNRG